MKMKAIFENTKVGYTVNGVPVYAEQLQRWAYNQLASAPDLLEACKAVMGFLDAKEQCALSWHIIMDQVKRAIKKAEGK